MLLPLQLPFLSPATRPGFGKLPFNAKLPDNLHQARTVTRPVFGQSSFQGIR